MLSPRSVVFVDTSVLLRLVGTDGEEAAREIAEEFDTRQADGQQFVIPATAIVEAGNRIARQSSDRRRVFAERLQSVLEAASAADPPWIIHAATLDPQFVQELLDGNSTGSDLVTLLGDGRLGTGDVALLVERDRFLRDNAYLSATIWTLDQQLAAYS